MLKQKYSMLIDSTRSKQQNLFELIVYKTLNETKRSRLQARCDELQSLTIQK